MKFYSFERLNNLTSVYDVNTGDVRIYDLFERTIYNNTDLKRNPYITSNDDVCRLDKVCVNINEGYLEYIEELIVSNNILNPFSIEENQYLTYVTEIDKIDNMHTSEFNSENTNKFKILNINKSKRSSNTELPPSVNPGLKQIDIDYDKKKITILNKFK